MGENGMVASLSLLIIGIRIIPSYSGTLTTACESGILEEGVDVLKDFNGAGFIWICEDEYLDEDC